MADALLVIPDLFVDVCCGFTRYLWISWKCSWCHLCVWLMLVVRQWILPRMCTCVPVVRWSLLRCARGFSGCVWKWTLWKLEELIFCSCSSCGNLTKWICEESGRGSKNIFTVFILLVRVGNCLTDMIDLMRAPYDILTFCIEAEFCSVIIFDWVPHEVCLSSGVQWVFISFDIFCHTVRAFWPRSLHFRGPFFGPVSRFGPFANGPCTFFRGRFFCPGLAISGPFFRLESLFFGDISRACLTIWTSLLTVPALSGTISCARSHVWDDFCLWSMYLRGTFLVRGLCFWIISLKSLAVSFVLRPLCVCGLMRSFVLRFLVVSFFSLVASFRLAAYFVLWSQVVIFGEILAVSIVLRPILSCGLICLAA